MCTPAGRSLLFKLLTHDLQKPMRVNVKSKTIPTNQGIKVKSGNKSKAVPSYEKSVKKQNLSLVLKLSRKLSSL